MSYANTVKKSPNRDWHKADIVAALRKAGWSLSRLAIANGYSHRSTLSRAMTDPGWPKGEEIIAAAIRKGREHPNIQPWDIWPSRYADSSKSTRRKAVTHGKNTQGNRHEKVTR